MSVFGGPEIANNGLVLHLDAANPRSYPGTGTTWTDMSGAGNNGTLINGVGYSTANKGGMVLDGTNDRGTFTTPITSTSQQTYEVWVKALPAAGATQGFGYILQISSAQQLQDTYMAIGYTGTEKEIFAVVGTDWSNMRTGVIGDATTVRQIVLTWNGSTQIAYVDGIQKVSQALTVAPGNFSTTMSFGDTKNTAYRQIVGNIYGIKIYNRAITASEVKQNFEATRGRYNV